MYVLDEPSIGLHQRDNDRLIGTLKHLRDIGNSVLVVEHDEDMIRAATTWSTSAPARRAWRHDRGRRHARPDRASPASLTGQYLSGQRRIEVPAKRAAPDRSAAAHRQRHGQQPAQRVGRNPVGLLTCVTGVSGSGKSTLINDTLYNAVARHLYGSTAEPAPHDRIEGLEHFDKVINVDQSPIGRTPRSNPATYTGLFTPIRELFAGVPRPRSAATIRAASRST
jgi:excinuclease ABC subunit A